MRRSLARLCLIVTTTALLWMTSRAVAKNPNEDFGQFIEDQLRAHAEPDPRLVLEDGSVDVVKSLNPTVAELRGNDLWICLPDGKDADALSDGCVRFASIRDTSAEPTGFIFFGSGEEALVNIQHRKANDNLGNTNHGALIKISGFKIGTNGFDTN